MGECWCVALGIPLPDTLGMLSRLLAPHAARGSL